MLRHALLALALAAASGTALAGERTNDLMVGDPAPPLRVAAWVKGEPIASLEKGKPYVVEFWATWCGPCRKAIPHVSELQKKYADQGLRIIGVSVWEQDPSLVEPFVEKMGDQMAYTVAKDQTDGEDKGQMARTWMSAAGQRGIPASFIVDREGRIAWIGHPLSIAEPLSQVMAGTWDIEKASAEQAKEMAQQAATEKLQADVQKALGEERFADALAALEGAFGEHPELETNFAPAKLLCLTQLGPKEKVTSYGTHLIEDLYSKEVGGLNFVAWILVDPESSAPYRDPAVALKAAERANAIVEGKDPRILDTYAMALFANGKREEALATGQKALELAKGTPLEKDLGEHLKRYQTGS